MRRFLVRLQKHYLSYVREAAAAADTCWERLPEPSLPAALPSEGNPLRGLLQLELSGGRG